VEMNVGCGEKNQEFWTHGEIYHSLVLPYDITL